MPVHFPGPSALGWGCGHRDYLKDTHSSRSRSAFELAISVPWIRAVAEQTLEDEVVQDEGGKLIKTRFRPFGVC